MVNMNRLSTKDRVHGTGAAEMSRSRRQKLPLLFLHVRASSVADPAVLEDLRNDLVTLASLYADVYAVRVKRRKVSAKRAAQLFAVYETRARLT